MLAVPVASRNPGWPTHVQLSGPTALAASSFAMTEQLRSMSRDRFVGVVGSIDQDCLDRIRLSVGDFLDFW